MSESSQSDKTMIDLFCGAGGLSCGLEMAGFKPVLANEMNDIYAETYTINHPDTQMIIGDIREINEKYIHTHVKKYGEVDLVAGGPPCQGFSVNAPIRSLDDQRNHLFKEFIRIVAEIKPRSILIENVPGIISLGKGTVVEQIYKSLNDLGYTVQHKILFAGHYGVPQQRFRTIFIGIRDWDGEITFPYPKYNSRSRANFSKSKELCFEIPKIISCSLKKQTTVWDAIGDLPPIQGGEKKGIFEYDNNMALTDYQIYSREGATRITNHITNKLSDINLRRLEYIPQGGSWRDIPYDLLPEGMKRAKRSDHTKRYGRLDPQSLCSTILTKCDPHWGSFFHPYEKRTISVREAARIQSFPDRYLFTGNITQQYEQVGNAVPPLLAKEVGIEIMKMLDRKQC